MSIDVAASHDAAETSNTEDPVSSCEITEADTSSFEIDESEDEATITDMLVDDVATAPPLMIVAMSGTLCKSNISNSSRSRSRSNSSSSHSYSSTYSFGNIQRDANANLSSDLNKNEFTAVVTLNSFGPFDTNTTTEEQATDMVYQQQHQQLTNNIPPVFAMEDTDNSSSKASTASHTTSSTPTTADVANVMKDKSSSY